MSLNASDVKKFNIWGIVVLGCFGRRSSACKKQRMQEAAHARSSTGKKLKETKKDLADSIVNAQTGQFNTLSKEEFLELLI